MLLRGIAAHAFLKLVVQDRCDSRLVGDEVLRLSRVVAEVVQLGLGRLDVLISSVVDGPERTPTKRAERVEALAVNIGSLRVRLFCQQAVCFELLLDGVVQLKGGQNGWRNAHDLHRFGHPAGTGSTARWRFDNQWNAQRRLIHEVPVFLFAVFAERLAMITGKDDQHPVVQAPLFQIVDYPRQLAISICDLSVVWRFCKPGSKWFRRLISAVWIIQVQP